MKRYMTDKNNKKQVEEKGGFNPVVAAVTGAVIGAGIAVAGAVALRDEKNREKVKEAFTNIKDQAKGYMDDMQKQVKEKEEAVKEKFARVKSKAT